MRTIRPARVAAPTLNTMMLTNSTMTSSKTKSIINQTRSNMKRIVTTKTVKTAASNTT